MQPFTLRKDRRNMLPELKKATPHSPTRTATRHELGPLQTTFYPDPRCDQPTLLSTAVEIITNTTNIALYRETLTVWAPPGDSGLATCLPGPGDGAQCLPPSATRNIPTSSPAFYSPGLFCPSGWTIAGSVVAGKTSSGDDEAKRQGIGTSTLLPDEIINVCCPGYLSFARLIAYVRSD